MKFTIKNKDAAEALKKCVAVSGVRSTLPILSCVRIEVANGEASIIASDLDRYVLCKIPAEIEKPGAVALSARLLSGILSKGDESTFEIDAKHKATIKSGGSTFRVAGLRADEFPETPKMKGGTILTMSADEWLQASRAVKWASSTEETRYTMNGVLVTVSDGKLLFVATDGRRLAKSWADFEGGAALSEIIPSDTIRAIDSLADGGGVLSLQFAEGFVSADCGGDSVISKLIEGQYPNWRQVIPNWTGQKTTRVQMPSKAFVEAIDSVAIVHSKGSSSIKLEVTAKGIDLFAQAENDDASSSAAAEVSGPGLVIAFATTFLRDPFRNWEDESLEIEMIDPMSPALIRNARSEYVLMPMRVTT